MTTRPILESSDGSETATREVLRRIGPYLSSRPINGAFVEVAAGRVSHDDDWWYVPVRLDAEIPHTWQYYDTLIEIEDEIARGEHLKVLLVPSA